MNNGAVGDTSALHAPSRASLTDQVYDMLLASLMQGVYEPGTRLSIDGLAREMDLSPTPVREALVRLESTGLVDRSALRGYRVAPLMTPTDIDHLMDARHLIEPEVTYRATVKRDQAFLAALQETIVRMKPSDHADNIELVRGSWAADEAFHSIICSQAGNPFIERAYRSLGGQLRRFRLISETGMRTSPDAVAEHHEIFAAISAGDAQGAADKMRTHIENARQRMLDDQSARENNASSVNQPESVETAEANGNQAPIKPE